MAVEAPPEPGVPLSCFPLCSDRSSVSVTPAQVQCLRQEVFVDGQVRMKPPWRKLKASQAHVFLRSKRTFVVIRRFLLCGDFISSWLQVTARLCSATETRTEVQNSLKTLHPQHKRLQEPDPYTVTHLHTEAHMHILPGIYFHQS